MKRWERKRRGKRTVTWSRWTRRWEFCPCLFPITPPNLPYSPSQALSVDCLKNLYRMPICIKATSKNTFSSLLWDRMAAAPPLAMVLQFFLFTCTHRSIRAGWHEDECACFMIPPVHILQDCGHTQSPSCLCLLSVIKTGGAHTIHFCLRAWREEARQEASAY